MGDLGSAMVLAPAEDGRGIFYRRFWSGSQHWDIVQLPGGGSRHPRGEEYAYSQGDGNRLRDSQESPQAKPELVPVLLLLGGGQ